MAVLGPWKAALLVPPRLRLRATPGPEGVEAARILYRQRGHTRIAPWAELVSLQAIRRGLGATRPAPLADIDALAAVLGATARGGAVIRSSATGRLVLALVGDRPSLVVKVGPLDDSGLRTEIATLVRLQGPHQRVLAPTIRWQGEWEGFLVLATEALERPRRERTLGLEDALELCLMLAGGGDGAEFLVHGDLAPWNMVDTGSGTGLVDWESSRFETDPLYDLAHYVTSIGSLLGSHTPPQALSLLIESGSPGWRYLEALGLDPATAPSLVAGYLGRTRSPSASVTRYRQAMLSRIHA